MKTLVERLEEFAAKHYHVERQALALEAVAVIRALYEERDALSMALDGARGCLKETGAEVTRLRLALWQIEGACIPGAADAALRGELAFALQAFARATLDSKGPRVTGELSAKPPEEPASLYDQIVAAIKNAPAGRTLEAVNEVIKVAKIETPKLSAEGRETMRAARQAYGVCEWWDEVPSQAGTLRRFKSSTCGVPEWRSQCHGYREMTLDKWIEEFGRCQCGRVIVMRGEDELAEGGA
jgi:hypothetical protein